MIWWPLIMGAGIALETGLGLYEEFKRKQAAAHHPVSHLAPNEGHPNETACHRDDLCSGTTESPSTQKIVRAEGVGQVAEVVLHIETFLRAGYAESRAGLHTWHKNHVIPMIQDAQGQYVQARNTIHTARRNTIPAVWETTRMGIVDAIDAVKQDVVVPFRHTKQRWLHAFRTNVKTFFSAALDDDSEQAVHLKPTLSTALFGLTVGGILVSPWLTLLSVPGLIYLSLAFVLRGYDEAVTQRKIGMGLLDTVLTLLLFMMGQFFAMALFFGLYYVSRAVLLKTQDTSRASLVNILSELPQLRSRASRRWFLSNKSRSGMLWWFMPVR